MNERKVYAAKMDAERFWEPVNIARLPGVKNKKLNNIVTMMDELSYVFCNEEDIVLTTLPMDKVHLKYLTSIGFHFENISTFDDPAIAQENEFRDQWEIIGNLGKNIVLSTYAVTDAYKELAKVKQWEYDVPDMICIKRVNSKKYSTLLAKELGFCQYSEIASSAEEFQTHTRSIFEKYGHVMVKEEFGVSGKGNYKISQEGILKRLQKEVEKQETLGRTISFIIEPCFEVKQDFSTQLYLDKKGTVEIISTQIVLNDQFKYGGSVSIDEEFRGKLIELNYYDILKKAVARLGEDGYFGDVCIDSMILKDGTLVPIVEINARKSMSLTKYNLDKRFLKKDTDRSVFFYVDCTIPANLKFEDILKRLEKEGLLYTLQKGMGVIPLTANTLTINAMLYKEERNKGRMYFYGVTKGDVSDLMEQARSVLGE